MARRLPVLVYGATGYTGVLICEELARRGIPFAIAGRNRDKLEALADRLTPRPEVNVAEIDDPAGLQGVCARAVVVLSAAGPFRQFGMPVQQACLRAGSHFLDITGETSYMLETLRSSSEWEARGLVAVNAVGFDVVPTDMAAWLACQELGEVEEVSIALFVRGAAVSQGTKRSASRMVTEVVLGYEEGDWIEQAAGALSREIDFGSGVGVRPCLSVGLGDVVTAPRTTGARAVRVFAALPRAVVQYAPPLLRLGQCAPVRALLGAGPITRAVERFISRGPEGPSPEQRERQNWTVTATARSKDGRSRSAWMRGRDCYGFTAVTAVEIARRLAEGTGGRKGALSPSQAVDVPDFLQAIRDAGITWEVSGIS